MELSCPSCSSKHRTEDYAGAFEIQCSCGYSILLPDENTLHAPAFEDFGALPDFNNASPMAQDHHNDNAFVPLADEAGEGLDPALMAAQAQEGNAFSSLNLTAPEDLPTDMPYDPFELQTQWNADGSLAASPEPEAPKKPAPAPKAPPVVEIPKPVAAQDIVNRIQMASIGYMHGALFDLHLGEIEGDKLKKLSEHCTRVLGDKPWLRAHAPQGFDNPETYLKLKRLSAIPELLAVEIYLHCAQNEIFCELRAHKN